MIPPNVLTYWQGQFRGGRQVFDNEAVSLTIDASLDTARAAMILTRDDGMVAVALQPSLAERAGLLDAGPIVLSDLRARLAASGIVLNDPDFLFYRVPNRPVLQAESASVRRLTEADHDAFDQFYQSASPQDRDDAWVEFDDAAVFGSFGGERLVCAASMVPWRESPLADLGVLTLPDARRRGHARAVIAAIAGHAVAAGYEPQYRCQTDNGASIALARSAGFASLGRWEVILNPDD